VKYLLDSNTCIAILKHQPPHIRRKLSSIPVGQAGISSIVLAELRYGVEQSSQKQKNEEALDDFLEFCMVLDWPDTATSHYARIRSELKKAGTPIGAMDLLIASHTLALDAILVTDNVAEFQRVADLKIENWLR
jgi:tRNA(fMet)-specific endonuclease VapC